MISAGVFAIADESAGGAGIAAADIALSAAVSNAPGGPWNSGRIPFLASRAAFLKSTTSTSA